MRSALKISGLLLMLLLGIAFAALNDAVVVVDLYSTQLTLSLGVALLTALLLGALLAGGVLGVLVIAPMARRLAQWRRSTAALAVKSGPDRQAAGGG